MNSPSPALSGPLMDQCDVCIVGAGIAGLNAAAVASQYLSRDHKIILIDRRHRPGGMWSDTYPYIRLHQPHPLFTAGNIKWTLGQERSYLATKPEVLDHFTHCLDVIKKRVQVIEYFGWTVDSHAESADGNRITAQSETGQRLAIAATRVIKANGFGVNPNEPLSVSSEQIHSVSPDFFDIRSEEMHASDTPIWIVGGGKTAMDTAYAAVTEYPGREVNVIAGAGTYFINRDDMFPNGARRLWKGTLPTRMFNEIALRFDGTNEDEVRDWFQATHGLEPIQPSRRFFNGLLSESEAATISSGLNTVDMEYFDDAIDQPDGLEILYRSGETRLIQPWSWLVNCSGYLLRTDTEYEPYISTYGTTLSINTRSVTIGFSSFASYFLTHLLFLGKLDETPLYELDGEDLARKSRETLIWTALTLGQYNLSLIFDAVPNKVFLNCGLNFDRWYPIPRRMLETLRFMRTHHNDREHHRQTLGAVRERFDVRCGPL
ncbi:FAD-dependent oxidoreductase [Rhodococcus globerulus]|uniref:FAD-dependent oxidoreductase n=1 Tax=Rhodococcus globerulus TaxID=33008 RepID=UPI0039E9B326